MPPRRRLMVMALLGCFALAFGVASAFEFTLGWILVVRLKMPVLDVANVLITIWRTVAALAVAGLLCIWLSRR